MIGMLRFYIVDPSGERLELDYFYFDLETVEDVVRRIDDSPTSRLGSLPEFLKFPPGIFTASIEDDFDVETQQPSYPPMATDVKCSAKCAGHNFHPGLVFRPLSTLAAQSTTDPPHPALRPHRFSEEVHTLVLPSTAEGPTAAQANSSRPQRSDRGRRAAVFARCGVRAPRPAPLVDRFNADPDP